MKKVTILEIAKEMNLSRNTVAKALKGGHVSNDTKMDVVRTALKMGYTKLDDELVEELNQYKKSRLNGALLVIYHKWEATRINRILLGISDLASDSGLRVQILITDDTNVRSDSILEQISKEVRGVIFLGVYPNGIVKEVAKRELPITFFNTPVNAQDYIEIGDVYSLESFYAMNKLIGYCIEVKHCNSFAFIGNAEGSRGIQARMLGFISACNHHGIKVLEEELFTRPEKDLFFSYNEVAGVLGKMRTFPDAFICEDDDVAKNVATWLYKNEYENENGTETVITGFGNTIEKDFIRQDILTVEVRFEELGKRLVMSVLERLENPSQDISFVTVATYPKIFR